jgi:GntR family transcriptional regulator
LSAVSPWAGFAIDQADKTPVYAQLERGIRSAIAAGRLAVGDQLPTVRQLAVDLRVNANTVAKVYAFLERAGVLETRRGVGTFIAARTPGPREETLRRTELNRLVDRFLAELSHYGFHVEDAMPEIDRRRTEGA